MYIFEAVGQWGLGKGQHCTAYVSNILIC